MNRKTGAGRESHTHRIYHSYMYMLGTGGTENKTSDARPVAIVITPPENAQVDKKCHPFVAPFPHPIIRPLFTSTLSLPLFSPLSPSLSFSLDFHTHIFSLAAQERIELKGACVCVSKPAIRPQNYRRNSHRRGHVDVLNRYAFVHSEITMRKWLGQRGTAGALALPSLRYGK